MAVTLKWHGPQFQSQFEKAEMLALEAAGLEYQRELKKVIGVSGRGGASSPGNPPRRQTGNLQKNVVINSDKSKRVVRVGVTKNAEYGLFLELGTSRMAARPWLRPTLARLMNRLAITATAVFRRFIR